MVVFEKILIGSFGADCVGTGVFTVNWDSVAVDMDVAVAVGADHVDRRPLLVLAVEVVIGEGVNAMERDEEEEEVEEEWLVADSMECGSGRLLCTLWRGRWQSVLFVVEFESGASRHSVLSRV